MPYIKRDLEKTITENLTTPEIIAILGPRQSGKTTLMRHIFGTLDNALYLSFEDRKLLELFVEDEKTFAELGFYHVMDSTTDRIELARRMAYPGINRLSRVVFLSGPHPV